MKIEVLLPEICFVECSYVAKVFFEQILGVAYVLGKSDDDDFHVLVPNGKRVTFRSVFWKQHGQDYLRKDCLPTSISFFKDDSSNPHKTPIIFGDSIVERSDWGVYYGADIFASAFFMLTRWEETVQTDYCDGWGRFPASKALAVKNSFITTPIVNCYAHIIKKSIEYWGYSFKPQNKFSIRLSVDIDHAQRWPTTTDFVFSAVATIIKRRLVYQTMKDVKSYLLGFDTYNTFSQLIQLAQSNNCQLRWYVLCDKNNTRFFQNRKELASKLFANEAEYGFHPSISAATNESGFSNESERLMNLAGRRAIHNRFHYLCGRVPQSWHLLEKYGFETDSSMYYTEAPGFRTGCCTPHSLFSVEHRRELRLTEEPLMVMDVSLLHGNNTEIERRFDEIKTQCKMHNGLFTVLWHNSSFENEWSQQLHVLKRMLFNNV